jgi:hypothetical protein
MLSTVIASLTRFGSADLFRIIMAATIEVEKRIMDTATNVDAVTITDAVTNVVAVPITDTNMFTDQMQPCKSRGKNCFSSGKAYQHHIYETLSRATMEHPHKVIEVDGAKSGPDILLHVKDLCVGWEVKNKGGFEGGSAKMTYRGDRLLFAEDTIHHQLLGDQLVYEGKNLPYYEGKTDATDYEAVKHIFHKELSKDVPCDTMATYYRNTGVHYIQIEGYGLYHTGHDVLHLEVPFFACEQRLRIRTSKHKKNGVPTDVVGDINYNKKTLSKSPFNIDHTLPFAMKTL